MKSRSSNWAILLTSLAVADSLVVSISFFTSGWLYRVLDARLVVIISSTAYCKISVFLQQTARSISAWFLLVATLERFVCITQTLRKRNIFTPRRTCIVIIFVVILACIVNIPRLIQMESLWTSETTRACRKIPMPSKTLQDAITWATITTTYIIPLIAISVMNAALMRFLGKWRAECKKKFTSEDSNCSRQMPSAVNPRTVLQLSLVSCCYIVLVVPYNTCSMVVNAAIASGDFCYMKMALALYHLLNGIYWLNYCNNFFLYVACNPKFRKVLLFRVICRRQSEMNSE